MAGARGVRSVSPGHRCLGSRAGGCAGAAPTLTGQALLSWFLWLGWGSLEGVPGSLVSSPGLLWECGGPSAVGPGGEQMHPQTE